MVLTLITEAVYAAVFAWVLVAYLRRRDPLQRDIALMFMAASVLFVLGVLHHSVGEPPALAMSLATALLLGQPYLTMRVIRRVGEVPRWLSRATLVGWLLGAAVQLSDWSDAPAATLPVVAAFMAGEIAAAVLFARLARERRGSPRTRLWLAAAATGLFAVVLLASAAGVGDDPGRAALSDQVTQVLALCCAVLYATAFVPPGWLRRSWSSRAGYRVVQRLLREPSDAPPDRIWQCYAGAVRHVTGAGAVVVLIPATGGTRTVVSPARFGSAGADVGADVGAADLAALGSLRGTVDVSAVPAVRAYAQAAGARFVTAAPMDLPAGPGLLLLVNRYRSLFADDDVQMLGELGGQAAALAQRAGLLADRDRLTAELSASVTALTAAGKAKSDFMANMSHELRTPLNAIIGFSDLMRTEPVTGDRTSVPTDWIEHIHSSGRHLVGLINEVLDLAKIESGKIDLRRESLDLSAEVGGVVAGLDALYRRKHIDVTVGVPPVAVLADRVRLRQILTNLLSNAVKFTPEHGRIFVAARRVGADIAISVADTGPGIEPADQHRVFEEFQQVGDRTAAAGGTGLGLALTRRLAQAHGGRVELESLPGHGSKFTVHLPATGAHASAVTGGHSSACPGILVVEDDPSAAELLSAYLTKAGYEVSVAATGEQCLAAARRCAPEAILLDVQLPGMDGWQVLAELKGDTRLRHVPVVIVSVVDEAEVGMALGAADYFVKPVDRHMLLGWLARHGLIPPANGEQITVLAIDDDPASLDLIEGALSTEGIRVVRAAGGAEGLRQARSRRLDLVICDLLMPDVDGFDVVAALHADPATRDVPIVVLTAHDLDEAEKERLCGKVVGITTKDGGTGTLRDLARTVGALTGAQLDREPLAV